VAVRLLSEYGPDLPFPLSSAVNSRHAHRRELRIQVHGDPLRVLYAFDPRRVALLLMGGDKTGDNRWYEDNVPRAEKFYERHLQNLKKEAGTAKKKGSKDG